MIRITEYYIYLKIIELRDFTGLAEEPIIAETWRQNNDKIDILLKLKYIFVLIIILLIISL
jgi:hypothetical protein